MDWSEVTRSVEASRKLLQSLWDMEAEAVAKGIDQAHDEISILQYNDENSLSCAIGLAFYSARNHHTIVHEMPSVKRFADILLIPRSKYTDKPAVVIELKKDKDAKGAITQIKQKNYVKALENYIGNLLLAGSNYDVAIFGITAVFIFSQNIKHCLRNSKIAVFRTVFFQQL